MKFIVKVDEINADVITGLNEYGEVEDILREIKVFIVETDEKNKENIKNSCGVLEVEEDDLFERLYKAGEELKNILELTDEDVERYLKK